MRTVFIKAGFPKSIKIKKVIQPRVPDVLQMVVVDFGNPMMQVLAWMPPNVGS